MSNKSNQISSIVEGDPIGYSVQSYFVELQEGHVPSTSIDYFVGGSGERELYIDEEIGKFVIHTDKDIRQTKWGYVADGLVVKEYGEEQKTTTRAMAEIRPRGLGGKVLDKLLLDRETKDSVKIVPSHNVLKP